MKRNTVKKKRETIPEATKRRKATGNTRKNKTLPGKSEEGEKIN